MLAHASMASCSYFGPYLVLFLHTQVFKWSQSWMGVFLTVSSNSACSVKAAVHPRNNNDEMENSHILKSVTNLETHTVHLNN